MAKIKDIKTKGVAFNLVDDYQLMLYEFSSKKTNFSNYVKTLIQRDMEQGTPQIRHEKIDFPAVEQEADIEIDFNSFC